MQDKSEATSSAFHTSVINKEAELSYELRMQLYNIRFSKLVANKLMQVQHVHPESYNAA